jgi:hypothetical protein
MDAPGSAAARTNEIEMRDRFMARPPAVSMICFERENFHPATIIGERTTFLQSSFSWFSAFSAVQF